nr:transcription factor FapR [uncultured Selenomonas sp.]
MTEKKRKRQEALVRAVQKEPFLTDETLAKKLSVSVQTVRLDRTELGIPELRARVRTLAENARDKVRAIPHAEVVGDLLSLDLGHTGTSVLKVTEDLLFVDSDIARGTALFSQANSLALAVVDAPIAMTGVANVKYKEPIHKGAAVIAHAEIVKTRGNKIFVWVKTYLEEREVFRAKFIVVSLEK